jgi:type I restriction enzyme S subunit
MWKTVKFEKCLEKIKISYKVPKKSYLEQGEFPIVSQEAALISGYHNDVTHVVKVSNPVVVFGDHTRVLKYIDFDFVVGADGVKILQPIDEIDAKFFFYILKLFLPPSTGYARHYRLLKKLDIPIPPLAEQQRIVAKLDAAFVEIDEATELLQSKSAEVKKLKTAILDKNLNEILVQKPKVKLSAACERVSVGHVGTTSKYYCDDGVPFIRTQNVSKNGFDDTKLKFITQEFHQSLKKSQLKAGDVLLSRVVIDAMHTAIVPSDYGEANCANVILIRPTQKLSSQFLSLLIQSRESQKYFMGVKKGAAQQVVNTGILKEWTIPLPTIEEQNRFEQTIKESFKMIENLNGDTHKKIEELKSAILAQELQSEAA